MVQPPPARSHMYMRDPTKTLPTEVAEVVEVAEVARVVWVA